MMEKEELRTMEPTLVCDSIMATAFSEDDGHVEVPAVIAACLRLAEGRGAEVRNGVSVERLEVDGSNRVAAVATSQGRLDCDAVVVAAGTDTPALAVLAGVAIPQPESPGIVIRTDSRPPLFTSVAVMHLPAIAPDRPDVHLRQLGDGTVRMGQGTQESLNRDDSQAHADDLLDRATHYLPALREATAFAEPVGFRPMPADGLPVLGFAAAAPNLYLAMMHRGVTLAPIVGALATLEIVDGVRVETLAPYRVERFA
jgi:glycine/D-amino acid oxidase-like deaminating enzyme